ncbi:MAG TPA: sulfatase/phosphatase domain-containing protein, partial [Puia sp.]|nr:sulfatase/phosphatase domain-containing protein [Puia sp.]
KPKEMTGRSLEALFAGKKPGQWRTSLYYHYYDYPAFHNVRRHDGVRTERYKLIHFYGKGGLAGATNPMQQKKESIEYRTLQQYARSGKMGDDPDIDCNELYDLQQDPHELTNVYGKAGYEKITAELQKILDKYRKDLKVDEY